MNETIKAKIDFVKENKKEILIGAAGCAGIAVLCIVCAKEYTRELERRKELNEMGEKILQAFKPKSTKFQIGVGTVTDVWTEANRTHMIIDNIPVDSCGMFGDALREFVGTIDGEMMDVVLCFGNDYGIVE